MLILDVIHYFQVAIKPTTSEDDGWPCVSLNNSSVCLLDKQTCGQEQSSRQQARLQVPADGRQAFVCQEGGAQAVCEHLSI